MSEIFSRRFGARPVPIAPLRSEIPRKFRTALVSLLADYGVSWDAAHSSFFKAVRRPRPELFAPRPYWTHLEIEANGAEWYEILDFVELLCTRLKDYSLEEKVTDLMAEFGIGWKVLYGQIETRGDEAFEQTVQAARESLKRTGRETAGKELSEALADLSRRPEPDSRGAIIRAVGALEALAKDLAKDSSATFGQVIDRLALPKPLDGAAAKLWGYASDQARHVTEGRDPGPREAFFVVQLCSAFIVYLPRPSEP